MKAIDFIFAARPMLHLPAWSFYLITYRTTGLIETNDGGLPMALLDISLLLSAIYYFNQIFDIETDRINRKIGFIHGGLITTGEMKIAALLSALAALALAIVSGGEASVIVGAGLALGYIYSAPPLRLKDRPLWGGVSNAFGYGFLIPMMVPGYFDRIAESVLLSLYLALAVFSIYLLTTIPDREGDLRTGKKTVATIWGRMTLMIMAGVTMAGTVTAAIFLHHVLLLIVSDISLVILLAALLTRSERILMVSIKGPIFLLTLLAGYYYPAYFLFVIALIILTRIYYRKRFDMTYPGLT